MVSKEYGLKLTIAITAPTDVLDASEVELLSREELTPRLLPKRQFSEFLQSPLEMIHETLLLAFETEHRTRHIEFLKRSHVHDRSQSRLVRHRRPRKSPLMRPSLYRWHHNLKRRDMFREVRIPSKKVNRGPVINSRNRNGGIVIRSRQYTKMRANFRKLHQSFPIARTLQKMRDDVPKFGDELLFRPFRQFKT